MTSIDYSSWYQEMLDEALASPTARDPIPRLPPPATPEEGAAELRQVLLLIEGFGLPEPDPKPIRWHTMLM